MLSAAALPSRAITEIPLKFRGRTIYMAGDQAEPETWETTFLNDTDFVIKNAIELWSNGINGFATNTGVIAPLIIRRTLQLNNLIETKQF